MEKERCFIITPIGKKTDDIRRHIDGIIEAVIKPVLENEYDVIVSHKINEIGSINKQIIKEIYNDKLVIANLTNINPNVMYELAFRHSTGKPVIIIAEEGTKLPFDISDGRTIYYKNDAQGTLELQETLKEFVSEIDFSKISSPIYDVLGEINKETELIHSIKQSSSSDDSNSLAYIINRLDSIESSISALNQKRTNTKKSTDSICYAIEFPYYKLPNKATEEDVYRYLSNDIINALDYIIKSICINKKKKSIIVDTYLKLDADPNLLDMLLNNIKKSLIEYGFELSDEIRIKASLS